MSGEAGVGTSRSPYGKEVQSTATRCCCDLMECQEDVNPTNSVRMAAGQRAQTIQTAVELNGPLPWTQQKMANLVEVVGKK